MPAELKEPNWVSVVDKISASDKLPQKFVAALKTLRVSLLADPAAVKSKQFIGLRLLYHGLCNPKPVYDAEALEYLINLLDSKKAMMTPTERDVLANAKLAGVKLVPGERDNLVRLYMVYGHF